MSVTKGNNNMRKPVSKNRCTAKISNGTRRCRKAAIEGSNVCRTHGGAAKQVKLAARRRLDNLAENAVQILELHLRNALESENYEPAIRTCLGVLDRIEGFAPGSKVEHSGEVDVNHEQQLDLNHLSTATKIRVLRELEAAAAGQDPNSVIHEKTVDVKPVPLKLLSGGREQKLLPPHEEYTVL